MRWIRRLLGLGACVLLTAVSCTPTTPAPTKPIASAIFLHPPTCGGGPAASTASMNEQAHVLATYINSYRGNILQNALSSDPVLTGVAQWHAEDMARNGYVGLVGTDGEDLWRRIVCTGPTPVNVTGALAIGYSTDAKGVFDAIQLDYYGFGTLYGSGFNTNLSIGYSNGYWVVLMQ